MAYSKIWILILVFFSPCLQSYSNTWFENITDTESLTEKVKKIKATIYLKNGSVIHGTLEQNDEIIVIKTRDGNIFAYAKSDIEKIELNSSPPIASGSYHQFGFGISYSTTEFNGAFNIVNGYQIGSKYYMGLGFGLEGYYNQVYAPITLDLQYHPFSDWDSQPYIGANFGKLLLEGGENNGLLSGVQMGFSHPLGNKVDVCTSVGYRYGVIKRQRTAFDPWTGIISDEYRRYEFNRLELRLSFMIN